MVFKSIFTQIRGEHPADFWNFFARHSAQTAKITLNDLVILADRKPFSSPTSSSLLQFLYGSCDKSCTFLASNFFRFWYFLASFRNSGVKYAL